jgi:hypothetical protein
MSLHQRRRRSPSLLLLLLPRLRSPRSLKLTMKRRKTFLLLQKSRTLLTIYQNLASTSRTGSVPTLTRIPVALTEPLSGSTRSQSSIIIRYALRMLIDII